MKLTKLALALLVGFASGCASLRPAPTVSMADLPNCFDSNYDRNRGLFTITGDLGKRVNQQCLLTVAPRGDVASPPRQLAAGSYRVYLANGGGGGAGGTLQSFLAGGGGGGGGGAGSAETQATVNLTEGVYKVTIGAGGLGGTAGETQQGGFGGGVGGLGSPSNIVRVATGEVVMGTPGADTYVRPSRRSSDRAVGKNVDAQGGSGPGQTTGGRGADTEITKGEVKVQMEATPGASKLASAGTESGGLPGTQSASDKHPGAGGGGGATTIGQGGGGGGESPGQKENRPERGTLGSGGGGGEGSISQTDPGARGGHGYVAFRPI